MIAAERGDHLSSEVRLEAALREPSLVWFREWTCVARALLLESRGDNRGSLQWFEKAWEECIHLELISRLPALGPRLVTLYMESGDEASARDVAKRLDEAGSTMLTDFATGASLLARGLVESDPGSLENAAEAFRRSPRVVERARAFEDAGLQLGVLGKPDGPDLLKEAIEIFETVGAQPLAARATAKLRSLGFKTGRRGRRGRPATGWEALTPTELEVVKLVAQGLTNKQIGGRLFISPRTVETHVTHAFQKLGFSARTELVAESIRRGI
jgi:DNA-binding CsgD family transcriptional regulator